MGTRNTQPNRALRLYLQQIIQNKRYSIPGLLLPGIGNVLVLYIPPLIIGLMIREFDGKIPQTLVATVPFLVMFIIAWLLGEALWRIAFLALNRTDSRSIRNLFIFAFDELLKKDIHFFNENFAGSLTKKVIGFSKNFEGFMDTLAFNVFGNLVPLIFACVILWIIQPLLVAALAGAFLLAFLLAFPQIKRRRTLTLERERLSNVVSGHIADVIGNIAAVKAFANEEPEQHQHEKLVRNFEASALKSWDTHVLRVDMIIAPIYLTINAVGLIMAIFLTNSAATMAAVFVTFSYFGRATSILFEFSRIYRNIENALTDANQFTELLEESPRIVDSTDASSLNVTSGKIEFRDASFRYQEDGSDLFDHLNLTIQPGERLALVGHSGGGKTTITKLLLRFNDISSGSLTIDGQDIRNCTLKSLRKEIAYVPQDPVMFHRTIRDNIGYGDNKANHEAIEQAAKKANAHDFILTLPDGYNTLVGERGVKLSGGQRQRIAIARAILKDAPILVLDEATSALDSESEKLIQEALSKLMKGRTSIVIAHRLSTIAKLDRIVVLDNGRIVEDGTHSELLEQKGIYAKLWSHQSGGFIEE